MNNKHLLDIIGEIDDRHIALAAPAADKPRRKSIWVRWGALAACAVFVIFTCFVAFAVAAEAKEYKEAVCFFNYYNMSTEGLTRGEIKAVYRDITTKSFAYSKTAEVIRNSISADSVGGYEIIQENPTPEDIENLWNIKNNSGLLADPEQDGIHYKHRAEFKKDANLGFEVHDKSCVEKYDGEALLWSVSISEFLIEDCKAVADGVIVYGNTYRWSSTPASHAYLAKISADGKLLWKQMLDNGFNNEYVAEIVENADGSYAVFSRGDLKYLCFSRYSPDGQRQCFSKTEVGNYGIWNAARFGDGYIVQLFNSMQNETARIVKVDGDGILTDSFSYSGDDEYYTITDMIEFNGKVYLSAYAVPKLSDKDQSAGGRHEIDAVLEYLFDNELCEISGEELTPMVRDNYTAILLVCDPNVGTPQEFYSVKGSLGGKLSVSEVDELIWDVESITDTFFSPATSSFGIGGTSYIFRYTFDVDGKLISQEKTGETVIFRR